VYFLVRAWRLPRLDSYVLRWQVPALVLSALALTGYIITIGAKENAALSTLYIIENFSETYGPTTITIGYVPLGLERHHPGPYRPARGCWLFAGISSRSSSPPWT
jgi:hypothetical protein